MAVSRSGVDLDLRVIVVANGCSDGTVALAMAAEPAFRDSGQELIVLDLPHSSKVCALNSAGVALRGGVTVYLDADVTLSPL
jgi:hypothetical protein